MCPGKKYLLLDFLDLGPAGLAASAELLNQLVVVLFESQIPQLLHDISLGGRLLASSYDVLRLLLHPINLAAIVQSSADVHRAQQRSE